MALELWELEQRKKGNLSGAEIARALRQQYGDVALRLIEPPTLAEFIKEQRRTYNSDPSIKKGYRGYGITQLGLAQKAGISLRYYIRLEKGSYARVPTQVLAKIAEAFGFDDTRSEEFITRYAATRPRIR